MKRFIHRVSPTAEIKSANIMVPGTSNDEGPHEEVHRGSPTAEIESANIMVPRTSNDEVQEEIRTAFLTCLPVEIQEIIFMFLTPRDLITCGAVCHKWREAINYNILWDKLCKEKDWEEDLNPNLSYFIKSHQQFHTPDSSLKYCVNRLKYMQHFFLQNNWRNGKYVMHNISNGSDQLKRFEAVSSEEQYLIMQNLEHNQVSLEVWSLVGVSRMYNLDLPCNTCIVDSVACDRGTIAVVQDWVIIVYKLLHERFEVAFQKHDLRMFKPEDNLSDPILNMTTELKVAKEYIICVPYASHSNTGLIPIFFWDITTGELHHTLNFDSMYYIIQNPVWFENSCYLGKFYSENLSHQIVEFGVETAVWKGFNKTINEGLYQIAVCNQYVLAVVDHTVFTLGNITKKLQFLDRATGLHLKTYEVSGQSFQFVGEHLIYFGRVYVNVMDPITGFICCKSKVSDTISCITGSCYPGILLILTKTGRIEVWNWQKNRLLYTYSTLSNYYNQLWCDNKRIIAYNCNHITVSQGILILGFW